MVSTRWWGAILTKPGGGSAKVRPRYQGIAAGDQEPHRRHELEELPPADQVQPQPPLVTEVRLRSPTRPRRQGEHASDRRADEVNEHTCQAVALPQRCWLLAPAAFAYHVTRGASRRAPPICQSQSPRCHLFGSRLRRSVSKDRVSGVAPIPTATRSAPPKAIVLSDYPASLTEST